MGVAKCKRNDIIRRDTLNCLILFPFICMYVCIVVVAFAKGSNALRFSFLKGLEEFERKVLLCVFAPFDERKLHMCLQKPEKDI